MVYNIPDTFLRRHKIMMGLGTIVNTAAIIVGGLIGMILGKKLPARLQDTLMKGVGVCVLFLGIAGALEKMLIIENGALSSQGSMMLIASVSIGAVIGELIDIDGKMEHFGVWLREKSGSNGDTRFVDGFVTASLTVCIGAMAVVGAIQDGIGRDPSTLIAKAVLDFIIVLIMSSTMGKGCLFSAIPVFLLQGSVTLLSTLIAPILTEPALNNLSLVGSTLIFCVGLNLVWGKKVKVANLLPAIIVAVGYAFLPF